MTKKFVTLAAVAALMSAAPALPVPGDLDGGAAYANNGNGNGNGGGNGNGNGGNGNGNGNNGNGNAGGNGNGKGNSAKAEVAASNANGVAAKDLGKMNGALNASVNAVLAHIKNGQTTNGPVGLMAGLAVADAEAAAAAADLAALQEAAAPYEALEAAVVGAGYPTVEAYLEAKAAGTATEEQMAAIDPLVEAVGGTTEDGLALAETGPTDEEIAAAEAAAAEADAAVDDVEAAIGEAANKDGDLEGLLGLMRDRLAEYGDEISATLASLEAEEATETTEETE